MPAAVGELRPAVAWAALLLGLLVAAIDLLGVASPHGLLTAVRFMVTPRGLYLVAALRVVFGVVLILPRPLPLCIA